MQEGTDPGIVEHKPASCSRGFSFSSSILWVIVVFIADRFSKMWIAGTDGVLPHGPFAHLITLTHHQNYGVIANTPIPRFVIIALTVLILGLVVYTLIKAICKVQQRSVAALSILLGGAIGNLYDRTVMGYVFDWILLFGRSAINIADVAIMIGAVWYLWEVRGKK